MNTAIRRWLVLAFLAVPPVVSGEVLLTEFLASNRGWIQDEDGDHTDWVEIFNSGPGPVNLTGWHLTDRPDNPRRWEFPERVLPEGEFLLVFASGKNRAESTGPLHTSFALAASGEYLALTDRQGTVVHAYVGPPPQSANHSYGLLEPSSGAPAVYFDEATPGLPNKVESALLDAPVLLTPDRTFPDSMEIRLQKPAPGTTIRYTLDDSDPRETSPAWAGPLRITKSTRLTARTFGPGRVTSLPVIGAWIRLAPDATTVDSALPLMILDNFNRGRPDQRTEAHWMIFPPGDDGRSILTRVPAISTRAAISVRGSSTSTAEKYSLAVEARYAPEEQTSLPQDRDIEPFGFPPSADWVLQAPYEYDRSLIRNPLVYQLSREIGRYAVRTRQVELYLNTDGDELSAEDYVGVYTFMEKIRRGPGRLELAGLEPDDTKAPRISGGYIFKIDRADPGDLGFSAGSQRLYWVEPKENEVHAAQRLWLQGYLNNWWDALRSPYQFDPLAGYARYCDVDSFADHHILNVAVKNVDALRLSSYFHKDRYSRIVAGPVWDFDRSIDSTDGRDNNHDTWRPETEDEGTDYFRYPWYNEMFRDPNFWQRWIDPYDSMRRGPLHNDRVRASIEAQADEVREAVPRNLLRWPNKPPRFGGWSGEIEHLRTWLVNRLEWIDARFTRPPVASHPGGPMAPGRMVTLDSPSLARPGTAIYYTLDGTDPRPFNNTQGQFQVTDTLVPRDGRMRILIPDTDPGASWRTGGSFDDATWMISRGGVGYDDEGGTFRPFFDLDLDQVAPGHLMRGRSATCLIRCPFRLNSKQLTRVRSLLLRIRFDDGFAAWLNGVLIATRNAPDPLQWNSGARSTQTDSQAIIPLDIPLTDVEHLLVGGENFLAIQGLNFSPASTDFLIEVELLGGYAAEDGPEFSGSALRYSGPIPITGTTHLMARTWSPSGPFQPWPYTAEQAARTPVGSRWSAPLQQSWLVNTTPADVSNLEISEIMYHPAPARPAEENAGYGKEDWFEFIELKNTGTGTLNLAGVRLSGSVTAEIAAGPAGVLEPGQVVLLAADPDALNFRYSDGLPIAARWTGQLPDSGGAIILSDAAGNLIRQVDYDDAGAWPRYADGAGASLEPDVNPGSQPGWMASLDPGGTPGGRMVRNFVDWAARHFSDAAEAEAQPEADPDRDGLPNLLEYAFHTDPFEAESPPPIEFDPASRSVTAARRAGTGALWYLESSPNLSRWEETRMAESVMPLRQGMERARWSLEAPPGASEGSVYFRLRVRIP